LVDVLIRMSTDSGAAIGAVEFNKGCV